MLECHTANAKWVVTLKNVKWNGKVKKWQMLQHFRIDSKWRRGRSRRLHTQCTDEKKQAWECKIKNGEKGKYEINKCSNNTLIDTVVLFRNLKSIFRYTGNILADKTNECGATAEDVKCWRTIYATILRFFFFSIFLLYALPRRLVLGRSAAARAADDHCGQWQ